MNLTEALNAVDRVIEDLWGDATSQPWLGNATTAEMLDELEARFDTGLDGVTSNELCANSIRKTREWLTSEELAYRTVDEPSVADQDLEEFAEDEEIDPYVIQEAPKLEPVYIYLFKGQNAFISEYVPDEGILERIEDGEARVLMLDDSGTMSEISKNGTETPLSVAIGEKIDVTSFRCIGE